MGVFPAKDNTPAHRAAVPQPERAGRDTSKYYINAAAESIQAGEGARGNALASRRGGVQITKTSPPFCAFAVAVAGFLKLVTARFALRYAAIYDTLFRLKGMGALVSALICIRPAAFLAGITRAKEPCQRWEAACERRGTGED